MPDKKYIVAFDQGTTSTRAIIFDQNGTIVGMAQQELDQIYPQNGWVEHDPEQIYTHQQEVFAKVLKENQIDVSTIKAIGITNQRETTIVWDKTTGKPIYNAINWLDKRTKDICNELKKSGLQEYVIKTTGLVIDSYFSATKIKWILDHVEGARAKAEKGDFLFGTVDTWLIWKFTNGKNHLTDHTNASRTLLYNIIDLQWDSKMLKTLDIPLQMLPKVQASASDFGTISVGDYKIPIYGVAGDQQAALFGQGGDKKGVAKNTYGTGCFMLLNTGKKPSFSKNGLVTTLCASFEDRKVKYALEGSIFVAGASMQWLRDKLQMIDEVSETESICFNTTIAEDLYVVPAFTGLGAPYWDMEAKGAIYGLSLDSGKNEIIKATVQSIAYQTRDVLEAMTADSGQLMKVLKVDGGASANEYLMQFQSDILNVEVDRPQMLEVTAFGAALLAGIKAGLWTKQDGSIFRDNNTLFKPQWNEHIRFKKYRGWQFAVERTKTANINKLFIKEEDLIHFSVLDRKTQLKRAKKKRYDLVVIGGGVTGAGIALDAASRGMKVCLIEKNDFASGTSNKSTKLIHGGLRYLKQFEIGLVKETGLERAVVHKLAPHLVVPEKMLLPIVEGGNYGKLMASFGLKVYDLLANVDEDDKRKMLTKEETLAKEPLLKEKDLLGGGFYAEYRTDDARLTIELLKKANEYGANCINYCEFTSFEYNPKGKIKAIKCRDHNSGDEVLITARNFVSAAGPWVDLLRKKDQSMNKKQLRLTKGVHLVFARERFPLSQSIYFDVPDGRMVFAIPRGRTTYVGTTDTEYSGNLNRVVATKEDARYLLNAVNHMFPDLKLDIHDIESNWAGLRPLIHEEGKSPSELSRKDEIFQSKSGLISIAGGKLTGYRKMSQRVIDALLKTMDTKRKDKFKKSVTRTLTLTDQALADENDVKRYTQIVAERLQKFGVEDSYFAVYLIANYGKQTDFILDKINYFLNEDIEARLIRAELWYTINYEMVNSLADFFVRRTGRLYFNIHTIRKYRGIVQNDFIKYLGWDEQRLAKENEDLDLLLQDATTYYEKEFD
ncbi:glycerol kinase GlpK [Aquimarina brevivitae]|uniref:Glycerol kinase n=1 Tax=Aquimarina brevivitae TaxID=323412 RepID=A0A4Q7PLD7_9FLAO|nr:glycerol kinase GlpK [Aquimarina brevivitae]RZS99782.1 glycerol kinase [Aquimarina brevivitae]